MIWTIGEVQIGTDTVFPVRPLFLRDKSAFSSSLYTIMHKNPLHPLSLVAAAGSIGVRRTDTIVVDHACKQVSPFLHWSCFCSLRRSFQFSLIHLNGSENQAAIIRGLTPGVTSSHSPSPTALKFRPMYNFLRT